MPSLWTRLWMIFIQIDTDFQKSALGSPSHVNGKSEIILNLGADNHPKNINLSYIEIK